MGALLATVLPLALGAAISPTLLALQLLVLAGPTRRLPRGWALAAGAALVLGGFSLLGFTVLSQLHGAGHHRSARDAIIAFVAAGLLGLLALRSLHHRPSSGEEHKERTAGRLANASTFWFLGVGAVGMVVNFSTLVLFLAALHEIARSAASTGARTVTFAILFVVTLAPVVVPVGLVTVLGDRADLPLSTANSFVSRHARTIGIGVEVVFAAYLVWKGFGELP
jgi:uncharacterized membrane protein